MSDRLRAGFWSDNGADVDGFIKFSLSVQNRRKARTGYAFENHLEQIFRAHEIRFDRQAVTEHNSRPDFLFPGADEYHDENFSVANLSMLGVKSTCKDRWLQVLSEAARIPDKHLLTLEPGISENQTTKMRANRLAAHIAKEITCHLQGQSAGVVDGPGRLCELRAITARGRRRRHTSFSLNRKTVVLSRIVFRHH